MTKTILITGSTDGIGLLTAKRLVSQGHTVIFHGRNAQKLEQAVESASKLDGAIEVHGYCGDLSGLQSVATLARQLVDNHVSIDVIINNAGVLKTAQPRTADDMDIRFVVNTIAPYLLSRMLLPVCPPTGRIINLSSAAQATVDLDALQRYRSLEDMDAYSQSKLAITMWSASLAAELGETGPMVISVNPGSLLATNMVKEGFGIDGKDINIGADILVRLATSDEATISTGRYFDNDVGDFSDPHHDALDADKNARLTATIDNLLTQRGLL